MSATTEEKSARAIAGEGSAGEAEGVEELFLLPNDPQWPSERLGERQADVGQWPQPSLFS